MPGLPPEPEHPYVPWMTSDAEFDQALLTSAFKLAAETGWAQLQIVDAARAAGLPLDRARARFPGRGSVLRRFGVLADQAALGGKPREAPVKELLFDALMRRIDVLQSHRGGVLALLRRLPGRPPLALALTGASLRSMRWILASVGVPATGLRGKLLTHGLLGVWLWTVRAWQQDDSEDLSATMAALDKALVRAEQFSGWIGKSGAAGTWPAPDMTAPEDPTPPVPSAVPPPDIIF